MEENYKYKTCDKCCYDILDDEGDVMEHECIESNKEKYYEATIKWSDNGNIEDGKILKIGDIGEDDDDIFFYLESEEELKYFKNIGHHEWTIIEVTEIINYKK